MDFLVFILYISVYHVLIKSIGSGQGIGHEKEHIINIYLDIKWGEH